MGVKSRRNDDFHPLPRDDSIRRDLRGPKNQTPSNMTDGLKARDPSLSEASNSSEFEVAGAGFEPATFGL